MQFQLLTKHFRRTAGIACLVAIHLPGPAAGQSGPSEAAAGGPLVVGQVVDLSGPGREFSRDFVAGAQTWFDHVNATGLLPGRRIRHLVKDSAGEAGRTLERTRELLEEDRASVLFGYVGDAGIEAVVGHDLFRRAGVALIGAASGHTAAPAHQEALFYLRASHAAEAAAVVEQYRLLGVSRFGIVAGSSESGQRSRREIEKVVRDRGLRLVRSLETGDTPREIEDTARRMATGERAQVILLMADSVTAALFVKAYRPLDPGISLVALSLAQKETILQIIGPRLAHGTLLTQVVPDLFAPDLPVAHEHLSLMRKYRDEPPTAATFEGFIAARALIEAVRRHGADASRRGVLLALRKSPRLNVGGIRFEFVDGNPRGAQTAELVLLRKDGRLLR